MASRKAPPSLRQEDQYGEAKACAAIKTEELQIDSVLPVEEDVRNTQPAFIKVEHGNHDSVAGKTSKKTQKDYREPASPTHDGNDQTHRDETNEKTCHKKIPKNLQCDECGQKYAHSQSLYRHQREEHGQAKPKKTSTEKLQCDQCERQFLLKGSLARHKKNFHGKICSRPCGQCGKIFALSSIHKHEMACLTNPNFLSCDECGKKFMKEFYLLKHKQNCSELRNQQCNGCELNFLTRDALRHHQKKFQCGSEFLTSNEQSAESRAFVSCDKCGRKFSTNNLLLRHSRICRALPKHQCQDCGRRFTFKDKLIKHKKEAHGEVFKQKCDKCDGEYSIYSMKRHKTRCKGSKLSCDKCGIKFYKIENLILHTQNCGDKPNQCDKCGQRFVLKRSLERHKQIVHGKLSTKACDKCGNVLSVFSMRRHRRICRGRRSKIVSCDECNKKFAIMGSLLKHKKIHHKSKLLPEPAQETNDKHGELELSEDVDDERLQNDAKLPTKNDLSSNLQSIPMRSNQQYDNTKIDKMSTSKPSRSLQCDECGQKYAHSQSLNRHKKLHHERVSPRMCKKCGIKFSWNTIKSHVRRCRGRNTLASCDDCGEKFSKMLSLLKHKQTCHGGSEVSVSAAEFMPNTDSPHGAQLSDAIKTRGLQIDSSVEDDESDDWNAQPASTRATQENNRSNITSEAGELQESISISEEITNELQQVEQITETTRSGELLQIVSVHSNKTRGLQIDSSVEDDDSDDWNAEAALKAVQRNSNSNIVSEMGEPQESVCNSEEITALQLAEQTSKTSRCEELLGIDLMHPVQDNFNSTLAQFDAGNGDSYVVIKTETNPDIVEPYPGRSNSYVVTEEANTTIVELDQENSNTYFVIKTEISENDHNFLEMNDSLNSETLRPGPELQCDECEQMFSDKPSLQKHKNSAHDFRTCDKCDVEYSLKSLQRHKRRCKGNSNPVSCYECGKKFSTLVSVLKHKRNVHAIKSSVEPTQKFPDDIQAETQADVIKTEEIHFESILPAIEEDVNDPNATTAFTEIDQTTTSASITTELSRDNCALPDVMNNSSIMERPSSVAPEVHCDECGRRFKSPKTLKIHIKVVHEGSTETCKKCGNEFTLYAIRKHRRLCSGPTFFSASCDECDKKFSQTASLLIHQQVCHRTAQEFNNDLKVAEEQVDVNKTKELHIESSLPVVEENVPDMNATSACADQRTTSSCIATKLPRDDLVDVIDNVERPSPAASKLQCNECEQNFSQAYKLRRHIIITHRGFTLKCEQCDHEFSPYSIQKHRQLCKGQTDVSLSCDKCDKKFTTTVGLVTHRQISHGIAKASLQRRLAATNKQCDKCGRSFISAKSLRIHIKIAHEGSTRPCQRCGNEFSLNVIQNHEPSCKGSQPSVSCDECGKKFSKSASLLTHKQISHGIAKDFRTGPTPSASRAHCDDCGQYFTSAKGMKKHLAVVHRGDTRMCYRCGNEFTALGIIKHRRLCNRSQPSVSCEECGKKFTRTTSLLTHKRSCHGVMQEFTSDLQVAEEQVDAIKTEELHIESPHPAVEENVSDLTAPPASTETDQGTTCSSIATELFRDECALLVVIKSEEVHTESSLQAVEEHVSDLDATSLLTDAEHRTTSSGSVIELTQDDRTVIDSSSTVKRPNSAASKLCCGECGQSFSYAHVLKRHLRIVHEGSTRTCEQCGNEFTPYAIAKHRLCCKGPTYFSVSCDECGKKFTTIQSLLTHRQVTHGVTEAPRLRATSIGPADSKIHCDECGRSFNSAKSLSTHVKVTHEGSTHTCEQCGNEFTPYAIRKHRRLCKGPTIFSASCDRCGKKFAKTASLLAHQIVCQRTAFTGNLKVAEQQANVNETQKLHIDFSLPVVDENDSDLHAPSTSTETDQGTSSSSIASEIFRDDCALPDVIDSSRTVERPSPAICRVYSIHEGSTQTCEHCGNEYSLYTIQKHSLSCKGPTLLSTSCDECGKKFTRTTSLLIHRQVSHGITETPNLATNRMHTPHGVVQEELASDPQVAEEQVDAIKTGELHVESLLPVVKEESCIETDQETNSSSIVTELSRDSCEQPDNSRSIIEQPSAVASKMHCEECGQRFTFEHALKRHIKGVHEGATRTCEYCGNEYTLYAIRRHRLSCKGPPLFSVSCEECGKKFSRTASLLTHRQVSHGITESPSPTIPKVHCDECGQSFTRKSSLSRHINATHRGSKRTWSSDGVVQEDSCSDPHVAEEQVESSLPTVKETAGIETDQETNSSSIVKELSRDNCEVPEVANSSSTPKQPNPVANKVHCDECGQSFTLMHSLKRHIKVAHEGSTRTCEQCGNEFTLNTIQKHRRLCKGPTFSASCDVCGKSFSKIASLLSHQELCHGGTGSPRSVPKLRRHRRPRPAASKVHCEECGQSFALPNSLRRHQEVAHRGTTRKCYQCGNEFTINAILKHRRLCKGPTFSASCDECGKKFTKKSSLLVHQQISHGVVPRSAASKLHCDDCGQNFSLASSLRRHINVKHKGSTRTCEQCGNEYTINTIRSHRLTCKGPVFSAACHECGKKFSKTTSLFVHQEICHGVLPEFNDDLQAAEEQVVAIKTEEVYIESLLPPIELDVSDLNAPAASIEATSSSIVRERDDWEHQEVRHEM